MTTNWQIRDSIATSMKLDEIFHLQKKIANHLGIDTEYNEQAYKHAEDFRHVRSNND